MKRIATMIIMILCLSIAAPPPAGASALGEAVPAAVSAANGHMALLDGSGNVWTWGRNDYGQLGNGTLENVSAPVKALEGAVAVSASERTTAAVKADGTLWMWGSNYHGQLGTGKTGDKNIYGGENEDYASDHFVAFTPVKVLENVKSVTADSVCTAAIRTDGTLWMWGDNQYGRIGNGGAGTDTDRYGWVYQRTPVEVLEDVSSVTIGADANAVAAIKTDGTLWMWGNNCCGQLGSGGTGDKTYVDEDSGAVTPYQTTPVQVLEDVAAVALGTKHTAAVKTDGSLWTWGENTCGQLGTGGTEDSNVPVKVLEGVASVYLGWNWTAAVKTDGTLWTWGWNWYGQLGNGTEEDAHSPVQVLEGVDAVGGSRDCAAALKTDGTLWTWGWNYYGQLGSGREEHILKPVRVLEGVDAAGFCQQSAAAVKTDGSLWTWGWNYYGQLGTGNFESASAPAKVLESVSDVRPAPAQEAPAGPFSDVHRSDYFCEPVLWAVACRITNGVTDTTFAPRQTCTNAQILTFLWRAMGEPEPEGEDPFTNVPETAYYAKAARWAWEEGMVEPGVFEADIPCTRGMTVSYLWQAAGRPMPGAFANFSDVPPTSACATAVDWAVEKEITNGTGDGLFSPEETCTRGQIAAFLYRALG